MLKDWQDACGHGMYDHLKGKDGCEIAERDDGFVEASGGPKCYFSKYDEWPQIEKQAMSYVAGKVLDIGCGAGRHSLHLQERGFDVVCIDTSPLAIEVCKSRGLRQAHVLSITQITSKLGLYDTLLMLGNNFGLLGNFKRAKWLLRRFRRITSEKGRIVAETLDPYDTKVPEHLEYHEFNRNRGRMPGEARLRIRYKKYVTPWFDYLFVSKKEMKRILEDTGWEARDFIDGEGPTYIAIIGKE
ncbi:MAG: class I SAM-dependent methyltransferase [Thermoplasmata archaeon]